MSVRIIVPSGVVVATVLAFVLTPTKPTPSLTMRNDAPQKQEETVVTDDAELNRIMALPSMPSDSAPTPVVACTEREAYASEVVRELQKTLALSVARQKSASMIKEGACESSELESAIGRVGAARAIMDEALDTSMSPGGLSRAHGFHDALVERLGPDDPLLAGTLAAIAVGELFYGDVVEGERARTRSLELSRAFAPTISDEWRCAVLAVQAKGLIATGRFAEGRALGRTVCEAQRVALAPTMALGALGDEDFAEAKKLVFEDVRGRDDELEAALLVLETGGALDDDRSASELVRRAHDKPGFVGLASPYVREVAPDRARVMLEARAANDISELYAELARTYEAQRRVSDAREAWKQAWDSLDPNDPTYGEDPARVLVGYLRTVAKGDPDEATLRAAVAPALDRLMDEIREDDVTTPLRELALYLLASKQTAKGAAALAAVVAYEDREGPRDWVTSHMRAAAARATSDALITLALDLPKDRARARSAFERMVRRADHARPLAPEPDGASDEVHATWTAVRTLYGRALLAYAGPSLGGPELSDDEATPMAAALEKLAHELDTMSKVEAPTVDGVMRALRKTPKAALLGFVAYRLTPWQLAETRVAEMRVAVYLLDASGAVTWADVGPLAELGSDRYAVALEKLPTLTRYATLFVTMDGVDGTFTAPAPQGVTLVPEPAAIARP